MRNMSFRKCGFNKCLPQSAWPASRGWKLSPFCGSKERKERKENNKNSKKSVRRLTIGAWNVRTLLDRTGTSRPERWRAPVDRELSRYKVDIAALSETRYACTGQETEKTYTFFWSGKSEKEKRESGVGFAIKTSLVGKIEGGTPKAIMFPLRKRRWAQQIYKK